MIPNFRHQKLISLIAAAVLAGISLEADNQPVRAAVVPKVSENVNKDEEAAIIRNKETTAKEIADLEQKQAQDKNKLSDKEKELAANQDHLQEETDYLKDLDEQDQNFGKSNLDEKISQQEEKIAEGSKEIADIETDLVTQKQNENQLISNLQNLQKKRQELQSEIKTKQKIMNQVNDQIQANKAELGHLIEKLEGNFKLKQQDLAALVSLKGQIKALRGQINDLDQQLKNEQLKLEQNQSLLQDKQQSLSQAEKRKVDLSNQIVEIANKEEKISSEMAYLKRQLRIFDNDEIADSEKDTQRILEMKDELASCERDLAETIQQRKENEQKLEEQTSSITKIGTDIKDLLALQTTGKQKVVNLVQDKNKKEKLYAQLAKENVNLTEKLLGDLSGTASETDEILTKLRQSYENLDSNLNKVNALAQEIKKLQGDLFVQQEKSQVLSSELVKNRAQMAQNNSFLEQAKEKNKKAERDLFNLRQQQKNKQEIQQKLVEQEKKVNDLKHIQARLQSELNRLQIILEQDSINLANKKDKLSSLDNQYELLLKSRENQHQDNNTEESKTARDEIPTQFNDFTFLSEIPGFEQIKIAIKLGKQWQKITLSNLVKLLLNNKQHSLKVKCSYRIKDKQSKINFYHANGEAKGVISNPDGETQFAFCEVKLVGNRLYFKILNSKYWLSATDLDIK